MNKKSNNTDIFNLIIIGNGFDLACGEKTSINDFIKYCLNKPKASFSHYSLNFIVWLLCRLYSLDTGLRWRNYLNFTHPELTDWMDFEKVINHLVLDEEVFNKINDIYTNSYEYTRQPSDSIVSALANYFANCNNWHENLYHSCSTFIDFLEISIQEFENQLKEYLFSIDNDLNITAHKELLLMALKGKYNRVLVMDFNYTNLQSDPFNPAYHIHGSTYTHCIVGIDPYYKNPGINNLYEVLGPKVRFTKVYKRLRYSNSQEIRQPVLNKNINRITFFGHSLGEQDYSYFQSVFDYFNLYESEIDLVFCYMEYEENPVIKESDRITERVFKLINRYGETLTNKDHGNNLLNKLLLEGRLVFYRLLPEDVFNKDELDKILKKYENGCD